MPHPCNLPSVACCREAFQGIVIEFTLTALPNLPQREMLRQIVPILWQQPDVIAIWLGGSLARGNGDIYSDVDLRVAVASEALETWRSPEKASGFFGGACVGQTFLPFGESAFLHHLVLQNGDIYDLWIQPASAALSPEAVLVLGCRDNALGEKLRQTVPAPPSSPLPAQPQPMERLLIDYWILTHKQRKVLYRGLNFLAMIGIGIERDVLRRLWHIQATGNDYGPDRAVSIFGLTDLTASVEKAQGERAFALLGAPLTNRADICCAIEELRDAIHHVGEELAARFGFAYPQELETIAREGWAAFLADSKRFDEMRQP